MKEPNLQDFIQAPMCSGRHNVTNRAAIVKQCRNESLLSTIWQCSKMEQPLTQLQHVHYTRNIRCVKIFLCTTFCDSEASVVETINIALVLNFIFCNPLEVSLNCTSQLEASACTFFLDQGNTTDDWTSHVLSAWQGISVFALIDLPLKRSLSP